MRFHLLGATEKKEVPGDLDLEARAMVGVFGFRQRLGVEVNRPIDLAGSVSLQGLFFAWCSGLGFADGGASLSLC